MELPEGVQIVRKPNGRRYYYWAPGRGTTAAGERVALGSEPTDPAFWEKLRGLLGGAEIPKGTFNALIREYRGEAPLYDGCPDWNRLRPRSKADYGSYLDRIAEAAGDRMVADLTKRDLYDWRNRMAGAPVAANHMLSIIRTLLEFAVEKNYRPDNPAIGIKRLKVEVDGAKPWPEAGWRYVLEHAPTDIRRMAILGRSCGQRISDLCRMRPADRHLDGFSLRISKLRAKQHFVPLTQAEIAEIDSWPVGPMDLYFKTSRNQPYTQSKMNGRWNRWKAAQPAIRDLPMTIHGLRATAVCDRRMDGMQHQEISNELCMSVQMVMRYSRFIDQEALARAARDRRERSGIVDLKTAANGFENARGRNG